MANAKISALPEKAMPSPADLLPIVDVLNPTQLVTKKTTVNGIVAALSGSPNGVASLDAGGKIPTAQLPAIAISDTFVVNSQAALLELVAEVGDVAVRIDLNKTFILAAAPSNNPTNWVELLSSGIPSTNVLDGGNF